MTDRKLLEFAVDYCLFFPNPSGIGGVLRLSGWAFVAEEGEKAPHFDDRGMLEIMLHGNRICAFTPDESREDVVKHYPAAPLSCGFSVLIHLENFEENRKVELVFRQRNGNAVSLGTYDVWNSEQIIHQVSHDSRFTYSQKRKLQNIFLNEAERLNYISELQSYPLYLLIDPSFACNLHCPYCHANMIRKQGYSLSMMSEDTVRKILAMFGETLIMVYLANWGEPFLNKKFVNIVKQIKEYDIWVTTSTNFSLPFSDEDIDAIVLSGLDHIIVSIDGATQETYEKYRQGGNLQRILDNIRRITLAKKRLYRNTPKLRWQYLTFPWNIHEVEDARTLAEELGCEEFDCHEGAIHSQVEMPLEPRKPDMIQMKPTMYEVLSSFVTSRKRQYKYVGCDHLYHQLTINSDGSVQPCCFGLLPKQQIGQIPRQTRISSQDLFNSEFLINSRNNFRRLFNHRFSAELLNLQGYEPCIKCWLVTDKHFAGYVPSSLSVFSAFEMIAKKPLTQFLTDYGKYDTYQIQKRTED